MQEGTPKKSKDQLQARIKELEKLLKEEKEFSTTRHSELSLALAEAEANIAAFAAANRKLKQELQDARTAVAKAKEEREEMQAEQARKG